MAKQTNDRPVHYYDTESRRVACGTQTADDRSTKHARGVTCGACIALLRERAAPAASSGAGA